MKVQIYIDQSGELHLLPFKDPNYNHPHFESWTFLGTGYIDSFTQAPS